LEEGKKLIKKKYIYIYQHTMSLKSSFPFFQVAVAVLSCWRQIKKKKRAWKGTRDEVYRFSFEVYDHTSNRIAEYICFL